MNLKLEGLGKKKDIIMSRLKKYFYFLKRGKFVNGSFFLALDFAPSLHQSQDRLSLTVVMGHFSP